MNYKKPYTARQKIGNCIFLNEEKMAKGVHQDRRTAKFLCHCGKEFISAIEYVKSGKTKSCGCLQKNTGFKPMPQYDDKTEFYFWSRGMLTANHEKCWNWVHGKDQDGYGKFNVKYDNVRAHRFAYYLHYKVDPKELQVCHTCDNPSCINPTHLFLGTTQENTRDRDIKGRHKAPKGDNHRSVTKPETIPRGSKHWRAKFTEEDILRMIGMNKSGKYTHRELGAIFNCHKNYISAIIRGKSWAHVSKIKNT